MGDARQYFSQCWMKFDYRAALPLQKNRLQTRAPEQIKAPYRSFHLIFHVLFHLFPHDGKITLNPISPFKGSPNVPLGLSTSSFVARFLHDPPCKSCMGLGLSYCSTHWREMHMGNPILIGIPNLILVEQSTHTSHPKKPQNTSGRPVEIDRTNEDFPTSEHSSVEFWVAGYTGCLGLRACRSLQSSSCLVLLLCGRAS